MYFCIRGALFYCIELSIVTGEYRNDCIGGDVLMGNSKTNNDCEQHSIKEGKNFFGKKR